MSAEPLEGFWAFPKAMPNTIAHYFLEGDDQSLCGKWRLREAGEHQVRPPGNQDCLKCVDIHKELFTAIPTPVREETAWTVKTDDYDAVHVLYYQGKEQSRVHGPAGLATQNELATLFNRNGTVPKKKARARCAADAKHPGRFLEQKSKQSPELPLSTESEIPTPTEMKSKNATTTGGSKSAPIAPDETPNRHAEYYRADDFIRYPENRLIQPDQAAKMKDSLLEVGMLQPVTARRWTDPETGKVHLQIIIGECRWQGALLIGEDYMIPAFVREISDKEAAKINAIENFQRQELDAVQEAHSIQNMKAQGWTHDEIENFLGVKKDYIYQRLTLLKLDEAAHTAIREGNLTLKTAETLAAIPEEQRAAALEAVVTPKYSTGALPQRDAIRLLERDFIEPQKQAEEWTAREKAVMENHPGAKWNDYKTARAIGGSNKHVTASGKPWNHYLSDSARAEELVVPTWGELAIKHGAPILIACHYDGEAYAAVEYEPIITAEKAACDANPAECIFRHESAVQKAKEDAERRKEEQAAHNRALDEERAKAANLVLVPDGLNKTTMKKLVECFAVATDGIESGLEKCDDLMDLFGIEEKEGEDWETETLPRLNTAMEKYLRIKMLTPFEALGRIKVAVWVRNSGWYGMKVAYGFETGLFKPADYPALYKEYEEVLAVKAREAQEASEKGTEEGETESEEDAA